MIRGKQRYFFLAGALLAVFVFSLLIFDIAPIAQAQETPEAGLEKMGMATGLQTTSDLRIIIGRIIKWILGFLGVLALGVVLYAGFLYMTSAGNPEKVTIARKWLINGAIGLAIIFSAYAITSFIVSKLSEAISGVSEEIAGAGGDGLGIGAVAVFNANTITPNTPASINWPVKIFFSKSVDGQTVNKANIQIIKKGTKAVVTKTLAPIAVEESNGKGAEILAKILTADNQLTGWTVCVPLTSPAVVNGTLKNVWGDSPMIVKFDLSTLQGTVPTSAIYKFENFNPSIQAKEKITCGDKNNPEKAVIKDQWLPPWDKMGGGTANSLILAAACFENVADNILYLTWKRTSSACIKFDYMGLEITYEDFVGTEAMVDGTFTPNGSLVKFTPAADCTDADCSGQKCFEKNTAYQVVLQKDAVKSNTGIGLSCEAGNVCTHDFTTAAACDLAGPEVSFVEPWNGAKVSEDANVDVTIKAIDDGGVSYIDFLVDDVFQEKTVASGLTNVQELFGYFSWNTSDIVLDPVKKKATKRLKGTAEDLDTHSASKEISVTVLPAYCFDASGKVVCDQDNTHPECGLCDGLNCNDNSDCAGVCVKTCADPTAKSCEADADCAAGVACVGECETVPVITNINPEIGGPGNYVTISGDGFLSYKAGISKVFFTGADGKDVEAQIVSCGAGQNSWNDNQIIVKVPLTAQTGPLKLVNADGKQETTSDDDGWQGEFEFDATINYPGLCAVQLQSCVPAAGVNCAQGFVNDLVKALGENFGSEQGSADLIYFGQAPAGAGTGFSWGNGEIKGIKIPVLDPSKYGVVVVKADPNDANKKIYSNPVNFAVLPSQTAPKIEKISPSPAPLGQTITIAGQYFGQAVGHVEFRRFLEGQAYDWVAELACGSGSWSDSEIIVKVPAAINATIASLEDNSVFSQDYQITVYTAPGLASNDVDFEINNIAPGPSLCSLTPNNGPTGTKFNLNGENFSSPDDYDIKFPKADGTVNASAFNFWSDKLIEKAMVPVGAVSGGVFLESKTDATKKSNSVNFAVGACKKDACGEGLSCCGNGICQPTCEVAIEYSPSEYMWLVSTGPLPILPQVLERSCSVGVYPQSPSPYKETEDACPNGLIGATFNMLMDVASFANNIEVRRCLAPNEKCDFNSCLGNGKCVAKAVSDLKNDAGQTNLYVECKTDAGAVCQSGEVGCNCTGPQISQFSLLDSLSELAGGDLPLVETIQTNSKTEYQLFKNTWYQVIIQGGQKAVAGEISGGVLSAGGKSLLNDYRWTFKTKNEKCVPDDLLLKPLVGLISDLYGTQKYIISGQYQCQEIALNNEDWSWGVQESYKNKILFNGYGCASGEEGVVCQKGAVGVRPDIGYYGLKTPLASTTNLETPLGQPAIIFAETEPQEAALKAIFDKLYKQGSLEVRFSAPKIISYYPSCNAACVNSEIGAHFSTEMQGASFTTDSVQLYSCQSADCVSLQSVTLSEPLEYQFVAGSNGNQQISNLKFYPAENLSSNTYYRVVVTNETKSTSQKSLAGLNYKTANAPTGDCGDWQDNDADNDIDVSGGYIFKGDDAKKIALVCGCYNQSTQKFVSYNEIEAKNTCPAEDNVVFACLNDQESVISDAADLADIAEDYNYFDPDFSCSSANSFEIGESGQYDAFSWVFKTKANSEKCALDKVGVVPTKYVTGKQGEKIEYWSNAYSAPDECSEQGQILNPFDYGWEWASSQSTVAVITNTKIMAKLPSYCTPNCLAKGSGAVGAVCGNGIVEYGEECEAINGSLNNNPYCNNNCLWVGFPDCGQCEKTIPCQINNTDCKEGEKVIACLPTDSACGCSQCCGNAQLEDYDGDGQADEECEIINALGQFPAGCSTKCTNLGSSYQYNSYCGDGIVGYGEDDQCEDSGAVKGAPYQVAEIPDPIDFDSPAFTFNLLTKFVEGATKITASTTENSINKTGEGELTYRTNDPNVLADYCTDDLEAVLDANASSPANNATGICRNALLTFVFNKQIDAKGGSLQLYKLGSEAAVESQFNVQYVDGKTVVSVSPTALLAANQGYTVKFFNIKNACGFYFDPTEITFTTGDGICQLDQVKIEPAETFSYLPNQEHVFIAKALSGEQVITEVNGLYDWSWQWSVDDTSIAAAPKACTLDVTGSCADIADKTDTDSSAVKVKNLNKNGTATITLEAEILTDNVNKPTTAGMLTTNSAKLRVLLCENLWNPTIPSGWDTLNLTTNTGVTVPTYIYEEDYNIGLLYCRDFGGAGVNDDLPKLKIVQQLTTTVSNCADGIDNDGDGKTDAFGAYQYTPVAFGTVSVPSSGTNKNTAVGNLYRKLDFDMAKQKIIYQYGFAGASGEPVSIPTGNNLHTEEFNSGEIKEILYQVSGYSDAMLKAQLSYQNNEVTYKIELKVGVHDPDCDSVEDTEEPGECGDGLDNDVDGKIDYPADKDCLSAAGKSEGNLLSEYFLIRDAAGTDNSTDVIALRIYKNPEFLPVAVWYQKYAPNPADATGSLAVDCQKDEFGEFCYTAAVDGPSVYVGASNLAGSDIYNNIYILSHSQNANQATLNIFNQMVSLLRFNFNLPTDIAKTALLRDSERLQEMVLTRLFIEQYKQTHNGNVPALAAGTYEKGMTFSVWPSWQNELGATLKQTLPTDPLNHFKWEKPNAGNEGIECGNASLKCPAPVANYQCVVPSKYCVKCPTGYDKLTCYDSSAQKFFNYYAQPDEHPVYSYQADPLKTGNQSAYQLDFMLEITNKTYKVVPGL